MAGAGNRLHDETLRQAGRLRERQDRVVAALFKANFEEGRNSGDHAVLFDIAEKAGLDRAVIASLLASDADRDLVLANERGFGGNAFYNIYECAHCRFVTLGGSEVKFAANLLTALGRPDLIDLCKLPPGPGQAPVRDFLRATFAREPLAHWEAFLAPIDVCWAPVRTLKEALASEQVRARGMRQEFEQQGFGGGQVTELGIPIRYREEPGRVAPEIPALGEHTHAVLQAVGLSPEEATRASGLAPGETGTPRSH